MFWKKKKNTADNNTLTPEDTLPTKPGTQDIKNIIAIASGKGGVGKSTVTTNLAFALQKQGYKVGVLDADLYGPSQGMMLGKREQATVHQGHAVPISNHGVKFFSMSAIKAQGGASVMRGPIAVRFLNQFLNAVLWGELDYLLIDLPPGTGDIQLTLAQQCRLTGGVIVTTPQKVALEISKNALDMFNTVNVPIIGIVENMSGFTCGHCHETTRIFSEGGGKELADGLEVPFLGAIPLDPKVMMSGDEGKSLLDDPTENHAKDSLWKIADAVRVQVDTINSQSSDSEPEKVQVIQETGKVNILWKDGEETALDPYQLRIACPCASCVDENTGKRTLDPNSVSLDIKATGARTVGRYGLNVTFSDNHNTGIYQFTELKKMGQAQQEFSL